MKHGLPGILLLSLFLPSCFDIPLDDASARAPRVGRYFIQVEDNKKFDVVIYYFDGKSGKSDRENLEDAVQAIVSNIGVIKKAGVLVVLCDLTNKSKKHSEVYPVGCYFKKNDLLTQEIAKIAIAKASVIRSPMKGDDRINAWTYDIGIPDDSSIPVIKDNEKFNNVIKEISRGDVMRISKNMQRIEIEKLCGVSRYYVLEDNLTSEVYQATSKGQIGTVRVWYNGETVGDLRIYFSYQKKK